MPADIDVRGFKAFADGWCIIQARVDVGEYEYELKTCIRLLYRCEKVQGEWKIVTLEPIYLHDLLTPLASAPNLLLDDLKRFRKSYRFTAWVMEQRGIPISNKLPGEDDAKSVEEIYERHQAWLNES